MTPRDGIGGSPPRRRPMNRLPMLFVLVLLGGALGMLVPYVADAQSPAGAVNVCAGAPSDMVCVSAGVFTMGSKIGDADEMPKHQVTLGEFLIDKYEVTFGQYMQCVQAQKCGVPRYYPPLKQRKVVGSKIKVIKKLPAKGKGGARPTAPLVVKVRVSTIMVDSALPAAGITWVDAKNYCEFKGRHLPTEAQWEYAARGAQGTYYAWGDSPPICERVNSASCGMYPKPAKSLPRGKSTFGAHHMTGNVWEWVHDWYDPKYYGSSANVTDPTGPANFKDPGTGNWKYRYRGLRGGSWSGIPSELRTAYRYRLLPSMYANDIGIRCAKAATPPTTRRSTPAPLRLARNHMPSQLVIRLLLWAVALNAGLLLLLLWRRGLQGRWGFAVLLAVDAALAGVLIYTGNVQHPLAIIAIGGFVFLVIVPMLIRMVTAWAVQRGRWELAHRLTAVRELLQPGAGVGRERELLQVIQSVQDGEVGDILTRLKERAAQEEDEELRGLLYEQCVTLMVIERRWDESLQYAAEHVTPHLVAARPRLGAALIRVYGEVGDVDGLVRTMYLVEGGAASQDPEYADVLEHCRIMVLAFTGQDEALGELLAPGTNSSVEPQVRHFWLGVAHQQAGNAEAARFQYEQALLKLGAQDDRARRTIEARRADVAGECEPVHISDPDQTARLVAAIRERAKLTMARPRLQTGTWRHTPVTLLLVAMNVVVFAAMELWGQGSKDHATLIQAGASLTHAVGAGEYWRLASAMFLHASWLHLAVNVFMLWFLGRFVEQLTGSLRFGIVYVVAGITGNVASHLWRLGPISVGASSSLFGILGAALVVLLLSRGRVPESWRRSMVFVLALVIGLNFLPGLDVPVIDNYAHLGGLLGGGLFGGLLYRTAFSGRLGSVLATVFGGLCVLVLLYCVWGVLTSDLDRLTWAKSRGGGATVSHPVTWFALPTRRASELEIVCLVHRDQVVIERMGPVQVGSLKELHKVRVQELRASAAKPSSRGRMTVHALPQGVLPRGWAGLRLEIHRSDGTRIAEAFALSLRGPPSAPVEWQALLKTRPKRFAKALQLFRRMLSELRTK